MDLTNEVVKHKKFGIGTIVESQSDYIVVLFHEANEKKKFIYPDALGEFLELQHKSSDHNDPLTKDGTKPENEHERIKDIKGVIRREKGIKKIIGIRQAEKRDT